MIDLHCHILPGIDDGSAHMEDAFELARALVADGVNTVAATPHLNAQHTAVRVSELADSCRTMNAELSAAGIPLTVVPGGEVDLLWAMDASDEDLRLATFGQEGKYLLLETPYGPLTSAFEGLIFQRLMLMGFTVLLAHPERNPTFQHDPERVAELVQRGILVQVTAPSLLSTNPRSGSRKLALRLLRARLAHCLASDSHGGTAARSPRLSQARDSIARRDPAYAGWLVGDAPAAILAGLRIPAAPPRPPRRAWRPWRGRAG